MAWINLLKEKDNETSKFDCDLVFDPVLFLLRLIRIGNGHPRHYPGSAGSGCCDLYPDRQVMGPGPDGSLHGEAASV